MPTTEDEEQPLAFVKRVGDALLRIAAMVCFGIVHWAINKLIVFIVPYNMERADIWLEDISFIFFGIIYVYLLWDLLTVFIPRLKPRP